MPWYQRHIKEFEEREEEREVAIRGVSMRMDYLEQISQFQLLFQHPPKAKQVEPDPRGNGEIIHD